MPTSKLPIGLQLYTLRDALGEDFAGTIRKVAEIGYAGVEIAGFGGHTAPELKRLLDDNNLRVAGNHVGIDQLEGSIAQVIDENLTLANQYVVVPWIDKEKYGGAGGYAKLGDVLNGFGETLQSHGLTLCYHNHAFEFEKQDGEYGLDILYANSDPALVKAEIDTYWVLTGGEDPVAYVTKYSGRVPLMHIKDRDPRDGHFAEVGTGDLPLDGLVEAANKIGTEWLLVEQDVCRRDPLESVTISFNNLKARGYV
jgi:sugar phosphate isomerase/epimerase